MNANNNTHNDTDTSNNNTDSTSNGTINADVKLGCALFDAIMQCRMCYGSRIPWDDLHRLVNHKLASSSPEAHHSASINQHSYSLQSQLMLCCLSFLYRV